MTTATERVNKGVVALERAQKGAQLLDERRPGWRDELKTPDGTYVFWMPSYTDCILGRLYGDYGDGTDELGLYDVRDVQAHGFECDLVVEISYKDLQEAWERLLSDDSNQPSAVAEV